MALITSLIIGRTGFIVSRLRHLQVMTVPEFYELKYTRGVQLLRRYYPHPRRHPQHGTVSHSRQ